MHVFLFLTQSSERTKVFDCNFTENEKKKLWTENKNLPRIQIKVHTQTEIFLKKNTHVFGIQ